MKIWILMRLITLKIYYLIDNLHKITDSMIIALVMLRKTDSKKSKGQEAKAEIKS